MHRSLSICLAWSLAFLAVAWSPGAAAAEAGPGEPGSGDDGCLELVPVSMSACAEPGDDSAAVCVPAGSMSLGAAVSAAVADDGAALVSFALASWGGAEVTGRVTAAAPARAADDTTETIRLCPPGTTPEGDTCRVRAPHDAPPGQGSGAPAPSLDPWLLHATDSRRQAHGRPVATAAPAPIVHPGFARVPERPPRPGLA